MEPVIIHAKLKAKKGYEEELQKAVAHVVQPSKQEEGCILYAAHSSKEEKGTVIFYERWASEKAFQLHINSSHYQQYREAIRDIIELREVHQLRLF
ncbi:hypothetical protein CHN50_14280 [Priestia aryabhattai]|uniref:putative quinol monooxygenase n=1 Tax=Bacillaceae TaxID=186817 RepID=UPI000BA0D49C|nr:MULTISPECIES: putative quinol monooxygenase [Bacillaceae]MDT2046217.1 putative quinol monooxygenase [Priestia flexa]OZT12057.1 hypothetical protein CHN50_14280 [Priestia aryabhattai]TDB50092.1 antibiotic biosynthesis monooxygenase [Bacillus sp. CBEL-1]USY53759.1 antibiotic biosynthesis monooxygenase [Bacillus sp. 1780r2a1]